MKFHQFQETFCPLQVGKKVADTTPQGVMISVQDYRTGPVVGLQCRPASPEEEAAYWSLRRQIETSQEEEERHAAECGWSL